MKFSVKDFFSKFSNLDTFTEEILNGKLYFLSSVPYEYLNWKNSTIFRNITWWQTNLFQKQPSRGVLRETCPENMQQITLRHGCSPKNLLHFCITPFYRNTYGGLLLFFKNFIVAICNYLKICWHVEQLTSGCKDLNILS